MYSIIFICDELVKFITEQGFNKSTINCYRTNLETFKKFCNERMISFYTREIGEEFTNDIYSPKTKCNSKGRYKFRRMLVRHFNHFLEYGEYVLIRPRRKRFDDDILLYLDDEYQKFKSFILKEYKNPNTQKFYLYEVYVFLRYLSTNGIKTLNDVSVIDVYNYFPTVKDNRQKAALCAIKFYLKYLERLDLYNSISGLKAIRKKKLIPYLTKEETKRIWDVLNKDDVSYRDKSLFLLGFTLGVRACDIVNLRLSDINWNQDYISFIQQKTGNAVSLPLSPVLGNSLFNYITKERRTSSYDNVFLSTDPPFKPLRDHSACYGIVRKIINKANINMNERFCGVHFLRHNIASNMVNSEVPLEIVAAVLGHSSPNSTNIYITTNESKLRDCVLSFDLLNGDNND